MMPRLATAFVLVGACASAAAQSPATEAAAASGSAAPAGAATLPSAAAASAAPAVAPTPLAAAAPAPLEPLVACIERGSFTVSNKARRGAGPKSRTVTTAHGEKRVSVDDGWRLVLDTPQGEHFVNLKLERSVAAHFASDREAIRAEMKAFAGDSGPRALPLRDESADGIELLGLDNPSINDRSIISMYVLMQPATALVATAYMLNQKPETRAFVTMAEYQALRDRALDLVRACLRQPASGA